MLTIVARAGTIFEDLDFSIGGRIKLDAIYSDRSVSKGPLGRSDLAFSPGSIPVTGDTKDAFHFDLRQSRLWATGHLPLYNRDLAAYTEVDFLDVNRNSKGQAELTNKPRFRHAYATYSGFTIGKTYTAFLNVAAFPEINDLNGPVGILNIRQYLLRYTGQFERGSIMLSLEEPDSRLTSITGKSVSADDTDWVPDIIVRLDLTGDRGGNLSVATMAREKGIAVLLLGVPKPKLFFMQSAPYYQEIAAKLNIPFEADILPKVLSDPSLKSDAIHPNAQGYQLIAEAVHKLLQKTGAL